MAAARAARISHAFRLTKGAYRFKFGVGDAAALKDQRPLTENLFRLSTFAHLLEEKHHKEVLTKFKGTGRLSPGTAHHRVN